MVVCLPTTQSICARHGLVLQILRVVPYSATQLYSYEVLKKRFQNEKGELSLSARLAAGGLAGMTATLVLLSSAYTCHRPVTTLLPSCYHPVTTLCAHQFLGTLHNH